MHGARLALFRTPVFQKLRPPREVAHASNDLRMSGLAPLKGPTTLH